MSSSLEAKFGKERAVKLQVGRDFSAEAGEQGWPKGGKDQWVYLGKKTEQTSGNPKVALFAKKGAFTPEELTELLRDSYEDFYTHTKKRAQLGKPTFISEGESLSIYTSNPGAWNSKLSDLSALSNSAITLSIGRAETVKLELDNAYQTFNGVNPYQHPIQARYAQGVIQNFEENLQRLAISVDGSSEQVAYTIPQNRMAQYQVLLENLQSEAQDMERIQSERTKNADTTIQKIAPKIGKVEIKQYYSDPSLIPIAHILGQPEFPRNLEIAVNIEKILNQEGNSLGAFLTPGTVQLQADRIVFNIPQLKTLSGYTEKTIKDAEYKEVEAYLQKNGLSITEDTDTRKMGGNFVIQFPEEINQDTFSNSYSWSDNDLDKVIDDVVPTSEKEPLPAREQLIKLVDRLYQTDFPDKEQTIAESLAILVTKETQSSGSYAFRALRSEISLEDIDAVQEHFQNHQQPEKAELIEKTKQTLSFDIPLKSIIDYTVSVAQRDFSNRNKNNNINKEWLQTIVEGKEQYLFPPHMDESQQRGFLERFMKTVNFKNHPQLNRQISDTEAHLLFELLLKDSLKDSAVDIPLSHAEEEIKVLLNDMHAYEAKHIKELDERLTGELNYRDRSIRWKKTYHQDHYRNDMINTKRGFVRLEHLLRSAISDEVLPYEQEREASIAASKAKRSELEDKEEIITKLHPMLQEGVTEENIPQKAWDVLRVLERHSSLRLNGKEIADDVINLEIEFDPVGYDGLWNEYPLDSTDVIKESIELALEPFGGKVEMTTEPKGKLLRTHREVIDTGSPSRDGRRTEGALQIYEYRDPITQTVSLSISIDRNRALEAVKNSPRPPAPETSSKATVTAPVNTDNITNAVPDEREIDPTTLQTQLDNQWQETNKRLIPENRNRLEEIPVFTWGMIKNVREHISEAEAAKLEQHNEQVKSLIERREGIYTQWKEISRLKLQNTPLEQLPNMPELTKEDIAILGIKPKTAVKYADHNQAKAARLEEIAAETRAEEINSAQSELDTAAKNPTELNEESVTALFEKAKQYGLEIDEDTIIAHVYFTLNNEGLGDKMIAHNTKVDSADKGKEIGMAETETMQEPALELKEQRK